MRGDGAWRVGKPYIWRTEMVRMAAINWPITVSAGWPDIVFSNGDPSLIIETFRALSVDDHDAVSLSAAVLLWNLLVGAIGKEIVTH